MIIRSYRRVVYSLAILALLSGGTGAAKAPEAPGARDIDPGLRGPVAGIGIESQDIVGMADRMVRDLLTNPTLSNRKIPPRIIVDSRYFTNESMQRLNGNLITDRLRVSLNRASQGRMVFIARQNAAMVEEERALKREGMTDIGTTGLTRAQAGADYRLTGNIASADARDRRTGTMQRFTQITFEMVDLESGEIVWSNGYDIARAATDDVIYR
ncbi:MAG TPA: penicillin-binding protein activator LpoB [Sphingopyxis sp.]|nr:penicillin-binding protein activator LpoB [Sphingopyxis sp.]